VKNRVSAIINTLNEERNIEYVLRSLQNFADEVIVVDMYSEDRTREVAERLGAKVYMHERLGYADPARAFALSKTSGLWIIMLDADEFIPENLKNRLLNIVETDEADVVIIPWKNYILGRDFRGTGWGTHQDKHMRFFKRNMLEITDQIHNFLHPNLSARVLELTVDSHVLHFNHIGFTQVIEKLNRYTTVEAEKLFLQGVKPSAIRAIYFCVREFSVRFLIKKGYQDKWQGLYMSIFMAFYRLTTEAKLKQLYEVGNDEEIEKKYVVLRNGLLSESKGG
jgi:glycosyltransferase involved in cell wall biosynthesis